MPTHKIEIPDRLARGHRNIKDTAEEIGRKWVETFVIIGGLTASSKILDIGCGPGRMALAIGERFGFTSDYIGFDVKADDIQFCQRAIASKHRSFRFSLLDISNDLYNKNGRIESTRVRFPCDDDSRDFVFATSIFTHFYRAEVDHYLREAYRCLRPGGRFLATFFCIDENRTTPLKPPRFLFNSHGPAGELFARADAQREAVAYELSSVRQAYAGVGFAPLEFHRGAWSGFHARHSQDVIVTVKPT